MYHQDTKRIPRLTAILTQLQTKRILTSISMAEKFGVSVRTIYRDIKSLQQAGIPIITENGKGYSLMEGYRIPPVMFTENEANALITAEQLVLKNSDSSLVSAYSEAINKIKAVLIYSMKKKVELLTNRIAVSPATPNASMSNSLTMIQNALTDYKMLKISYQAEHKNEKTKREVEPFALYYSLKESWTLIAYCQLRKDFRMFRLDRILQIETLATIFTPHKITLKEYLEHKEKNFYSLDIPLS